jgi:hypothetical protein
MEAGHPEELRRREDSRYRALLEAEQQLDASWSSARWRKWNVAEGALRTDVQPRSGR